MESIDALIMGAIGLIAIFPALYILYKKGNNKLFYIASCFGVVNLTFLLFSTATAPISLLFIKVIPQLAEYGYIDNILFLLHSTEFVYEYYFIILYPTLSIVVPILIYKRYSIFHLTKIST